jgi:hypothetical protein
MALASDLRVMGQGSVLRVPVPAGRAVGRGHGGELVVAAGGRPRARVGDPAARGPGDAERCLQIGLANRVVVDDRTVRRSTARRSSWRRASPHGPHFAARMTKTMLQQELDMGFTDGDRGGGAGPDDVHAAPGLRGGRHGAAGQAGAAVEVRTCSEGQHVRCSRRESWTARWGRARRSERWRRWRRTLEAFTARCGRRRSTRATRPAATRRVRAMLARRGCCVDGAGGVRRGRAGADACRRRSV